MAEQSKGAKELSPVYVRLPTTLVQKMRVRAKKDGRTLRAAFARALKLYLRTKEPDPTTPNVLRTTFAAPEMLPQDPQASLKGDTPTANLTAADTESDQEQAISLRHRLKALSAEEFKVLLERLRTEDLQQVARMTRRGCSKDEIAKEMGRSERTISSRLGTISKQYKAMIAQ